MKKSIKFIAIIVVMATVVLSCKKVDGPKPSQTVYLTAHSWYVTSYNGNAVNPDNCSQQLVLQFSAAGKLYVGNNCATPANQGSWTLTGSTIDLDGEEFEIIYLDGSSFTFKNDGDTYICEGR